MSSYNSINFSDLGNIASHRSGINKHKKNKWDWLRTLPLQTPIVVQAAHVKTGQAGERWNSYKEATTLGELAERNPDRFLDDLKYDLKHGLVRLGVAGTQGVTEVRSVVGALDLLLPTATTNDDSAEVILLTSSGKEKNYKNAVITVLRRFNIASRWQLLSISSIKNNVDLLRS